jgi:hypothetical protein
MTGGSFDSIAVCLAKADPLARPAQVCAAVL